MDEFSCFTPVMTFATNCGQRSRRKLVKSKLYQRPALIHSFVTLFFVIWFSFLLFQIIPANTK